MLTLLGRSIPEFSWKRFKITASIIFPRDKSGVVGRAKKGSDRIPAVFFRQQTARIPGFNPFNPIHLSPLLASFFLPFPQYFQRFRISPASGCQARVLTNATCPVCALASTSCRAPPRPSCWSICRAYPVHTPYPGATWRPGCQPQPHRSFLRPAQLAALQLRGVLQTHLAQTEHRTHACALYPVTQGVGTTEQAWEGAS